MLWSRTVQPQNAYHNRGRSVRNQQDAQKGGVMGLESSFLFPGFLILALEIFSCLGCHVVQNDH
jgi:hypothetical protein